MNLIAWLGGTWAANTWASGSWQEAVLAATDTDPGRASWEINDKNRKRLIRAMRKRDRLVQDEAEIEYLIQMGCI